MSWFHFFLHLIRVVCNIFLLVNPPKELFHLQMLGFLVTIIHPLHSTSLLENKLFIIYWPTNRSALTKLNDFIYHIFWLVSFPTLHYLIWPKMFDPRTTFGSNFNLLHAYTFAWSFQLAHQSPFQWWNLYYYRRAVHKNLFSQICPQKLTDFEPRARNSTPIMASIFMRLHDAYPLPLCVRFLRLSFVF